jgi:hypothetical protein
MTSFANLPPPKTNIRRVGVLNGASWGVWIIATLWNAIWFFVGIELHFNKWLAGIPNFPVIVLCVSTAMVLMGATAAAIAMDVLFHRRGGWIAFGVLFLWMTPTCIGTGSLYLGRPDRRSICIEIAAGVIVALIVRFNSPLLRSRELKTIRGGSAYQQRANPTPAKK